MQVKKPISPWIKIFIGVTVAISVVHIIDFAFYGKEIQNLLGAVGFAMMAYGASINGFRSAKSLSSASNDHLGRYATIVGVVLALASFLIKWLA